MKRMTTVVLATIAAVSLAGCSIQIQSAPDPSIPDDTMLLAADNGSPLFEPNFNPFLVNKRVAALYVYEPLLILDNVTGVVHPWLAESYELPDPSTVIFTLREGVTWQDGERFDADDVIFTLEMLKEFPATDLQGIWNSIDTIEADGMTVTIRLNEPNVPIVELIGITSIVPEHVWSEVDDPTTFRDPEPMGTGPYMLGNFAPQQYSMDKYQDYWQADKVAAEHLVLPASNTQLDIATKGYDWAFSYISDVDNVWVGAGNENSYWFPPGGTIVLFPNLTKAPFDDLDFRQGLSLSLNRGAVGETAAEGYMDEAGQTNILLPYQEQFLNPDIPNGGIIEQDVDAAYDAFARAGYELQGDRLVGPDGAQVTMSITTANGYTDWLRGVQELERQWEAVGIDVRIETPQPAAYQLALRNGDFDLAMGGAGGTGSVYRDFNALLNSDFVVPVGEEASNNFQRYSSPQADALLDAFKVSTDEQEQLEIGYQLQQIMYDELPAIALYYGGSWGLVSNAKFTGWPTESDPYASPKTYEATPLLVLTNLRKVTR